MSKTPESEQMSEALHGKHIVASGVSEELSSDNEKTDETRSDALVQEEALVSAADEDQYPTGLRLVIIVVALFMAVFLYAIDMVRSHAFVDPIYTGIKFEAVAVADHFTRPLLQQPFPRLPMISTASMKPRGTDLPFS